MHISYWAYRNLEEQAKQLSEEVTRLTKIEAKYHDMLAKLEEMGCDFIKGRTPEPCKAQEPAAPAYCSICEIWKELNT